MNNVLLIWGEFPDTIKTYHFDNVLDDELKIMILCHNKFVNVKPLKRQEEGAIEWLNEWLMGKEPIEPLVPYVLGNIHTLIVVVSGYNL